MDRLLTEHEAANILNVKVKTLQNWRSTKRYGLKYIKLGTLVRYRMSDLLAFLDSRACG